MGDMRKIITKNSQETQDSGKALATFLSRDQKHIHQPFVCCLYGSLGSGKTTFVQGFAKGLGISCRLPSPTFIIVRRYDIAGLQRYLYHIDLYRTKYQKELEGLGIREIFQDPRAVILIEWAERLGSLLPAVRTDITFEVMSEEERKITFERSKS